MIDDLLYILHWKLRIYYIKLFNEIKRCYFLLITTINLLDISNFVNTSSITCCEMAKNDKTNNIAWDVRIRYLITFSYEIDISLLA